MDDVVIPSTEKNEESKAENIGLPEVLVENEVKVNADRIVEVFKKDGKTPVITDKKENEVAPSGDPHDYISVTRYMMRRENGGMEFKDGVPNPGAERYVDVKKVEELKTDLFFITAAAIEAKDNNEDSTDYIEYTNAALQRWFINEYTRMNSNLEFAQMINGEATGQYFGIIEGSDFLFILEQVEQLRDKDLIAPEVLSGVKVWYEQYLTWLVTSEKGIREKNTINNHGTWYDVQVAQIADFLGKEDLVLETLERAKGRIESQITSEGEMPREKARRDTYGYPLYNLNAYSKLATIGEKYGVDLWNYESINGGGLKKAFEYFVANLPGEDKHPIPDERNGQMYITLRAASKAYGNPDYFDLPAKHFPNNGLANRITKEMFE